MTKEIVAPAWRKLAAEKQEVLERKRAKFEETQAADQGVLEQKSASLEESKRFLGTWKKIFRYLTAVETHASKKDPHQSWHSYCLQALEDDGLQGVEIPLSFQNARLAEEEVLLVVGQQVSLCAEAIIKQESSCRKLEERLNKRKNTFQRKTVKETKQLEEKLQEGEKMKQVLKLECLNGWLSRDVYVRVQWLFQNHKSRPV